MSTAIKRLGELRVESFVEGTTNNWLVYKPLPNSKMHTSVVDYDVEFIASTPSIQIAEADLDIPIPEGFAYAFSVGTDNKLKVAFSKSLHTDKTSAINALKCASITYQEGNLTPNGNLFVLTVKNSLGEEIHRTTPITLDQIKTVISTFNDTRATEYDGSIEFVITPDYLVS